MVRGSAAVRSRVPALPQTMTTEGISLALADLIKRPVVGALERAVRPSAGAGVPRRPTLFSLP